MDGDWLLQKRIETRKKCIPLLQTLFQGEPKSPAEGAGLPSLGDQVTVGNRMGLLQPRMQTTMCKLYREEVQWRRSRTRLMEPNV